MLGLSLVETQFTDFILTTCGTCYAVTPHSLVAEACNTLTYIL